MHPTPCHTRALLFSDSGDPCPRLLTPPPTNGFIHPTPTPAFSPPSPRPGEGSSQQLVTPLLEGLLSPAFSALGLGALEGGLMKDCSAPRSWWHRGHVDPSDHNSHSQTCHL